MAEKKPKITKGAAIGATGRNAKGVAGRSGVGNDAINIATRSWSAVTWGVGSNGRAIEIPLIRKRSAIRTRGRKAERSLIGFSIRNSTKNRTSSTRTITSCGYARA